MKNYPLGATGLMVSRLSFGNAYMESRGDDLFAEKTWRSGKGIIAMKVMGCGELAHDPQAEINFVDGLPFVHSLVIGMRSLAEIEQTLEKSKEKVKIVL
jgi:aryl-alcohol dehydrogenase-like predicted oxidoreductase